MDGFFVRGNYIFYIGYITVPNLLRRPLFINYAHKIDQGIKTERGALVTFIKRVCYSFTSFLLRR